MNIQRPSFALAAFLALFSALSITAFAAGKPSLSTIAGTGVKGSSGDGGPAIAAQMNEPCGVYRAADGSVYVCDTLNHRIRRISSDGKIKTIAGTGERGWSGDNGPATAAKLNEPYEVRLDANGNVYWVERLSHSVRKLDAKSGNVTTIAGTGTPGSSGDGKPATEAQLNDPHSIVFDKNGDLFIADVKNHRIRKVDMKTGIISTFSGTGERLPTPDGAPIATAPLSGPRALDFDQAGNLWVALREGNAVLKFDLEKGTVHQVAGTGKKGYTGNGGPAKEATLNGPKGISVGPNGNVYIADTENHAIRMIDVAKGTLEAVAGTGERGDGTISDPLRCGLARPHGVFVDSSGAIYIGNSDAPRVLVIK